MRRNLIHQAVCLSRLRHGLIWVLAGFCFMLSAPSLRASESQKCLISVQHAAKATGVPAAILLAVAKVETGRSNGSDVLPWPWAINVRGKGNWLESKSALLEQALKQIALGENSFDVGCFQLNYRWHGQNFSSLDEMISPRANALYAARFLRSLFAEFGNWSDAVGAYHSRTETYANAYKAKFAEHYDPTSKKQVMLSTSVRSSPQPRSNFYPLLKADSHKPQLGSLVPSFVR